MFNWMKKILLRTGHHYKHTKHRAHQPSKQTSNPTRTPSVPDNSFNQPIHKSSTSETKRPSSKQSEAKKPSTVLMEFVDQAGNQLKPTEIISGSIGDPINFIVPQIKNYILVNIDGLTRKMRTSNQLIKFHYMPKLGQPVSVYCFDFDTFRLLQTPIIVNGSFHHHFSLQAPVISNYDLHLSIGDLNGQFTEKPQNIILYYRRSNWKVVQSVNYLVKMKIPTSVYDSPQQNRKYDQILPAGSTWKVFTEIKTNQGDWLNLGGSQWVKKHQTIRVNNFDKRLN
ncbi:MucBP domain-containing protein [Fructilactobacillus fructivorans]|uniref:MucBP domain-containing protein n=1 Tax=Fructilactobacillus fructivorans TaxID=1614 RepID=A0A0C1PKW5_9LACO|nr:MucBP domain-containing protein [Fructilactobacillus fructivorans]KID41332.1 hypothetical protein LfDm3_0998 [Fructilactobacillus fructivorans]MCT0151782.1 hypothetical protein [Fructilactobacillus fructivorans]MCT2867090.1 hypothetical protein [Fructilactobacillus fructivorans]MCT2868350.1 hypothetical protein [Fructilactobacillus fructivorans]MCT2873058.1 hypothetical protein [Fructilactobacillus fructivorans]